MWLTVNVINFEEKFDLVIRTLTSELVHGIDKFLQWNATIVIFVENVKYPFNKKWLKYKWNQKMTKLYICMYTLQKIEIYAWWNDLLEKYIFKYAISQSYKKNCLFHFYDFILFPNEWPTVNVDKSMGHSIEIFFGFSHL